VRDWSNTQSSGLSPSSATAMPCMSWIVHCLFCTQCTDDTCSESNASSICSSWW